MNKLFGIMLLLCLCYGKNNRIFIDLSKTDYIQINYENNKIVLSNKEPYCRRIINYKELIDSIYFNNNQNKYHKCLTEGTINYYDKDNNLIDKICFNMSFNLIWKKNANIIITSQMNSKVNNIISSLDPSHNYGHSNIQLLTNPLKIIEYDKADIINALNDIEWDTILVNYKGNQKLIHRKDLIRITDNVIKITNENIKVDNGNNYILFKYKYCNSSPLIFKIYLQNNNLIGISKNNLFSDKLYYKYYFQKDPLKEL